MKKILVNFTHPKPSQSKMNIALRKSIEDIEDITINDLYAHYPDLHIDVKREQELCEKHDVIVFQHPFYWYSTPAIIKEWQDLVLQHGWAYGSKCDTLKGKYIMHAITAGGDQNTYQKNGYNKFTIAELISPHQATANLCKMKWLPPFTIFGIHRGLPNDKISAFSEDYRRVLIAIRDDRVDYSEVVKHPHFNDQLSSVIKEA